MARFTEEYHLKLPKFMQRYGRLDFDAFAQLFSVPLLLFELTGDNMPPKYLQSYAETADADVRTATEESMNPDSLGIYVAPIQKCDRNKVPNSIFIGRKPWCDIVVPNKMVSKMHAFFRREGPGRYTLTDLSSKYGTVVRDQRLLPNDAVPLNSRDKIDFAGAIQAWFLSAEDFYEQREMLMSSMG
jgi:pSer/pThr/pTyr-binding forkhead associated (FHA) protein